MKSKRLKVILKEIEKENLKIEIEKVKSKSQEIYDSLVLKYNNDSKGVKKLTLNNMFPVIAGYKSLVFNGLSQEEAFEIINKINYNLKLQEAKQTSGLLKVFGLYKLYPSIFKKVTLGSFNKENGFDPEFIKTPKNICEFKMHKCLFYTRLEAEGCLELLKAFCNTDDAFNLNLHQNILWKRTQTLADEKEYCDFHVEVKKKA